MIRLLLLLCLLPLQLWAAWGGATGACTATEKVSDTSLGCTVATANFEVNNVAIFLAATDNIIGGDSETSLHASVTDTKSNSYQKLCEWTNGQNAGGQGATTSVWRSKITTELVAATDTITLTTASAVTAKAIRALEFTITAANVVVQVGVCQMRSDDNADAGALSISGLASQEYLFVRGIAYESDAGVTGLTATTGYISIGVLGTTGGAEAGNMGVAGEYDIVTATSTSSDPTFTGDTTHDNASVLVALKEVPAATRRKRVIDQPI